MDNLIAPTVQVIDNKLMVSSLNIADVFGKKHKNVLRDIESLLPNLDRLNFEPISYLDRYGRQQRMYLLDNEFTILLIMGFTGEKAFAFKQAYIREFNKMRELLNSNNKYIELEEKLKETEGKLKFATQQIQTQAEQFQTRELEHAKEMEKHKKYSPYFKENTNQASIFGDYDPYRNCTPIEEYTYKRDHNLKIANACFNASAKYDKILTKLIEKEEKE